MALAGHGHGADSIPRTVRTAPRDLLALAGDHGSTRHSRLSSDREPACWRADADASRDHRKFRTFGQFGSARYFQQDSSRILAGTRWNLTFCASPKLVVTSGVICPFVESRDEHSRASRTQPSKMRNPTPSREGVADHDSHWELWLARPLVQSREINCSLNSTTLKPRADCRRRWTKPKSRQS